MIPQVIQLWPNVRAPVKPAAASLLEMTSEGGVSISGWRKRNKFVGFLMAGFIAGREQQREQIVCRFEDIVMGYGKFSVVLYWLSSC